jgi:sugar O-acyltransferase (sialic acid O-acetyltransferase NeuD family)
LGASGHGKVLADIFLSMGVEVAGFVDARIARGENVLGLPVLGGDDDLPRLAQSVRSDALFVAIGDNWVRSTVVKKIRAMGVELPFATAIHPAAVVAQSAEIGPGTAVMAGAVVNPEARIEAFAIVNSCASVDHESVVAEYGSLAPHSSMGGNAKLGEFSVLGQGAIVIHGVSIGEHSVVGAGAVAVRDIPGYCVAYGAPARAARGRDKGEPYL